MTIAPRLSSVISFLSSVHKCKSETLHIMNSRCVGREALGSVCAPGPLPPHFLRREHETNMRPMRDQHETNVRRVWAVWLRPRYMLRIWLIHGLIGQPRARVSANTFSPTQTTWRSEKCSTQVLMNQKRWWMERVRPGPLLWLLRGAVMSWSELLFVNGGFSQIISKLLCDELSRMNQWEGLGQWEASIESQQSQQRAALPDVLIQIAK